MKFSSADVSLIDMSTISYTVLRPRLLSVPGVANIAIWGQRKQQFQVQVDPERLAEHGISLDQVKEATATALDSGLLRFTDGSVIGTGGMVETATQRIGIKHAAPIVAPTDLEHVRLTSPNGTPVALSELATLVESA